MRARQLFRENYADALRHTAITSLHSRALRLVAILREKKFDRARERTRVKLTLCRRGVIAQRDSSAEVGFVVAA